MFTRTPFSLQLLKCKTIYQPQLLKQEMWMILRREYWTILVITQLLYINICVNICISASILHLWKFTQYLIYIVQDHAWRPLSYLWAIHQLLNYNGSRYYICFKWFHQTTEFSWQTRVWLKIFQYSIHPNTCV